MSILLLGVPAGEAAKKATNTTGVASLLLSVAVAGLGATVAKETAKNTLRSTLLYGVSAGQTTEEATNATRVTALLAVVGAGAAVAKEAAKNAPGQNGLENVLL